VKYSADEFLDSVLTSEASTEAFARTEIIKWPGEDEAEARYHEIEDRIEDITFAFARRAIAEAFVIVANAVLERERGRERG